MGTSKRFILKFGVTACLLAILICEGFLLYCHYVKHVDAVQYASEKLKLVQEWISSSGTQTANAQASDTSGAKENFRYHSVIQKPVLFVSAKSAIDQMIQQNNAVLAVSENMTEPEHSEDQGETSAEAKEAEPAKKTSPKPNQKHIPAKSADPSGMTVTNINELLERQRADGITENTDNKIQLDAESILQNPELPTGCEVTSLAMALSFHGYGISKEKLADEYLEKAAPGTVSYRTAFWGDPRKEDSFGCFAPVITKAANQFLAKKKSPHMAYNLTGTPLDDLLVEIRMGYPVIVWGSMYINGEIVFSYGWEIDGETVTWPSNEHCMLLIGFDTETNSVIVCDPLAGITSYDKNAFQHHYDTLEQQAIVIY